MHIAAAAVKLAHAAEAETRRNARSRAVRQRARQDEGRPSATAGSRPQRRAAEPALRGTGGDVVRLFIGAGREAGIRPGDLVGAITGEAGIASRDLGAIEIADRFSLIDVPESRAEEIVAALRATTLRGKKVMVRRDRGPSANKQV